MRYVVLKPGSTKTIKLDHREYHILFSYYLNGYHWLLTLVMALYLDIDFELICILLQSIKLNRKAKIRRVTPINFSIFLNILLRTLCIWCILRTFRWTPIFILFMLQLVNLGVQNLEFPTSIVNKELGLCIKQSPLHKIIFVIKSINHSVHFLTHPSTPS